MKELHLTLPRSWAELSEDQALYISKIILDNISELELMTRCFMRFTGIRIIPKKALPAYFWFRYKKETHLIDADTFGNMISWLDWIKEEVKLFKNPAKIGRYVGCNFKLFGISLEEYLLADQMYIAYSKSNKMEFLNKLVAICYRKKTDSWNEGKKLAKWTRRFRFTPKYKKYLVYLWFTGVKASIIETYPYIFQTDSGGSITSATAHESVLSILATLSQGDISKYNWVKRVEVHEALDMLNRKCKTDV